MPWTLYRLLLRDMLRLLILSTLVLVTVISVAVAIKPLGDGVLGIENLGQFLLLTAPTVLSISLPFAGAFAGTMVFIRFTTDNEMLACRASGISYRTVLLPVGVLGLALTMGVFFMSNSVIPRFYRQTALMLERDLVSLLVNNLQRHEPYQLPGRSSVVFADTAQEVDVSHIEVEPGTQAPSKVVLLTNLAVGELSPDQRVISDTTAQRASLLLYQDMRTRQSWVMLRLQQAVFYDAAQGSFEIARSGISDMGPFRVPSPFRDNPKYFSWGQLRQLSNEPERFDAVRKTMGTLAQAVSQRRLRLYLDHGLFDEQARTRGMTLLGPREGERYTFRGGKRIEAGNGIHLQATESSPIEIDYLRQAAPTIEARKITPATLSIQIGVDPRSTEPVAIVTMTDARVFDVRSPGRFTEHPELRLPRLVWPEPIMKGGYGELGLTDLVQVADNPNFASDEAVSATRGQLAVDLLYLARRIISQSHIRAASAITALLVLLIAAVISLQMRGQMPLVVYFLTFLLTVVTVIITNTGEHFAGRLQYPIAMSLCLLWSGNVILLVALAVCYCRLARR